MSSTDKRIAYFKKEIFDPYKKLLEDFPQERIHQHFFIQLKKMQFSYAAELMFKQILPALPHGNDGLIFTCRSTGYKHGTDHHILKWKPEDENSIDFRLCLDFPLIQPDEADRTEGVTEPYLDYDATPVFNLHVFADSRQEDPWYGTMYMEPREWEELKARQEPLNDRIVECYMDSRKQWRFMRFRDDKDNANHTSTVESVIESIRDRVTKEDLIEAAPGIRAQWKIRDSQRAAAEKGAAVGVKRKADDQGRRDSSAV
jgi:mRNA guanylyltransferase